MSFLLAASCILGIISYICVCQGFVLAMLDGTFRGWSQPCLTLRCYKTVWEMKSSWEAWFKGKDDAVAHVAFVIRLTDFCPRLLLSYLCHGHSGYNCFNILNYVRVQAQALKFI